MVVDTGESPLEDDESRRMTRARQHAALWIGVLDPDKPWTIRVGNCCRGESPTSPKEFFRIYGELEPEPLNVAFEATYGWDGLRTCSPRPAAPRTWPHPLATKAISSARVKNDAVDAWQRQRERRRVLDHHRRRIDLDASASPGRPRTTPPGPVART